MDELVESAVFHVKRHFQDVPSDSAFSRETCKSAKRRIQAFESRPSDIHPRPVSFERVFWFECDILVQIAIFARNNLHVV